MLGVGALISGGASLLSGLFGRSSAKKQAKKEEDAIRKANEAASENAARMNREVRARADAAALVPVQTSREHFEATQGGVDMGAFMAAAENYGFNPLTFLRSGALSLFANSQTYSDDFTCTTGERAMDAALAGQYVPQLSPVISQTKVPGLGDVFGGAIQAGANQYLNDLSMQENNDFQMKLLNARLAGQNLPGAYSGSRSFFVPSAGQYGGTTVAPTPVSQDYYLDDGTLVRGASGNLPDPEAWFARYLLEHSTEVPGTPTRPWPVANTDDHYLNDPRPWDTLQRLRSDLWNVNPFRSGRGPTGAPDPVPWF